MSIVGKAVSASGPIMRVLIGAGAFTLLIFGLKQKREQGSGGTTGRRPSAKEKDAGAS